MNLEDYAILVDYYPINRGAFLGIVTVDLGEKVQLRMRVIRANSGSLFVNMPTEKATINGEDKFIPMIKFRNEKFERELCEHVKNLIKNRIEENERADEEIQEDLPF